MRPKITVCLALVAATAGTVGLGAARAQGQQQNASRAAHLAARERQERLQAVLQITAERTVAVREITEGLQALDRQREAGRANERAYGSAFHVMVKAAGNARVVETVPDLVKHLDYSMDPTTFPVGGRYATAAYFPAAEALANIGGRATIQAILRRLGEAEANEATQRAAAYVLSETLGADVAALVITQELTRTSASQARANLAAVEGFVRRSGSAGEILRVASSGAPNR